MSRRPAFQFYPADWRTDAGLRLCSISARGLWIEMMAVMHDGEPYGHLTIQGRQIAPDMLARIVGESASSVKRLLNELEANDVFSRTERGIIFSRRMVRDEEARERRAAGGQAGAEHGHKGGAHGIKGGRPKKEKTPLGDEGTGDNKPPIKPPPSSSSSSSSAEQGSPNGDCASGDAPDLTIEEVVEDWNTMATELGLSLVRKITPDRRKAFRARLREYPDLSDWKRAFVTIRSTPFLLGDNRTGWQADFNFLLQAKSFTKLTEEAYGQAQRHVA